MYVVCECVQCMRWLFAVLYWKRHKLFTNSSVTICVGNDTLNLHSCQSLWSDWYECEPSVSVPMQVPMEWLVRMWTECHFQYKSLWTICTNANQGCHFQCKSSWSDWGKWEPSVISNTNRYGTIGANTNQVCRLQYKSSFSDWCECKLSVLFPIQIVMERLVQMLTKCAVSNTNRHLVIGVNANQVCRLQYKLSFSDWCKC